MKKADLLEKMRQERLPKTVIKAVEPLITHASFVRVRPLTDRAYDVGATKAGGTPDLPKGIPWPIPGGRAHRFLAQLDLSDADDLDLPEGLDGMLYFFIDDVADPPSAVVFQVGPHGLAPASRHPGLPDQDVRIGYRLRLERAEEWRLPRYDSPEFAALGLEEDDAYAYEDFEFELDEAGALRPFEGSELFGAMTPSTEVALASIPSPHQDWRVLLTLDPFEDQAATVVFRGLDLERRVHFFIREDDLARGRFDDVAVAFGKV